MAEIDWDNLYKRWGELDSDLYKSLHPILIHFADKVLTEQHADKYDLQDAALAIQDLTTPQETK